MWTSQLILAHFLRLAENVLVTRRELLNYGTQAAVDSTIRRLHESTIYSEDGLGSICSSQLFFSFTDGR